MQTNLSIQIIIAHDWGLGSTVVRLDVPFFGQPDPDYCVPACIKMVLEHIKNVYDGKIPRLSISNIATSIRTRKGRGTSFDTIKEINELLSGSEPSVEFFPEFPCEWEEVEEENDNRNPIIAWKWLSDNRGGGTGHSVVVIDVNHDEGIIVYNDPLVGEKNEDVGSFISAWEDENVNRTLIKVRIGMKIQKKIPDYPIKAEEE